jgi:biotin-(acetyl-CoA carboxylase) ligase
LLKGRKVCGVLVEQGQATVVGIGLNVTTPAVAFAADHLRQAGSLAMFAAEPLDRQQVLHALLRQLDANYESLEAGLEGDLEARWRWHSGLLGKQVALTTQGQTHQGRIMDLSFAAIDLQEAEGHVRRFAPDRVEAITPCASGLASP